MWCIPEITPEFTSRMEAILDLYQKPYNSKEPVICFDEKSKQLISDIRKPLLPKENKPRKRDYEYKREGVRNIFLAVEPKAGFRTTHTTEQRTKRDTAKELKRIIDLKRYQAVEKIHFVLDNLNTHFNSSLIEMYGKEKTESLLKRVQFHYTPTHASWLNMAEIELSIMTRQALQGRIGNQQALQKRLMTWKQKRNKNRSTINWKFTKQDARNVFRYFRQN